MNQHHSTIRDDAHAWLELRSRVRTFTIPASFQWACFALSLVLLACHGLAEAAALDPVGEYRDDSQVALGFGHWQIGRAVNFWALTHSYFAVVALFGFVVFGLLGLAVALSAPMLLREIRVRAVPEPLRSLAAVAWRREHRLRFLNATVVAAVHVLWLIVLTITR